MIYKRIFAKAFLVIIFLFAVACYGCSVSKEPDSTHTDSFKQTQTEESSSSSNKPDSGSDGNSSGKDDSSSGKDDVSSSDSTISASESSSGSGKATGGDSSSGDSETFIEVYATGTTIRWNASENIYWFEIYIDGERQMHTMENSYPTNLKAGLYMIEVFGFMKDETKACCSSTLEYVVKISRPVVTVKEENGKTLLNWHKCEGADGYKIYRNGEIMSDTNDLCVEINEEGTYKITAYSLTCPQINSDSSASVTIGAKANVPSVSYKNGVLTFTTVGANHYAICYKLDGKENVLLTTKSINVIDLKGYAKELSACGETAEIYVKAYFGENNETRSASVFVNVSELI